MEDTRPWAAAEEVAEPEKRRMEQGQAGERREHEADCVQPVVGAYTGAVTQQRVPAAKIVHVRISGLRLASRLARAASSSRSSTSLRPTRTKWKKPASALSAIDRKSTRLNSS